MTMTTLRFLRSLTPSAVGISGSLSPLASTKILEPSIPSRINAVLAPSALFMIARLYHEMYGQFKIPMDLGESIAYYEDIVSLYSQNRLADDAIFAIANILMEDRQNHKKAARVFKRIIITYPDGHLAPAATEPTDRTSAADKHGSPIL